MADYTIVIAPMAARQIRKLPLDALKRVGRAIGRLSANPRPPGAKALQGSPWLRIRAGDYRVIYEPKDRKLIVLVVKIGHRRDVYRDL